MVLLSGDIANNYSPDNKPRKENNIMALQCADKNGLVIHGNGQRYDFKQGDSIPDRIFTDDFGDQGIDFCQALIGAGRIKEVADEKKVKKEKKEEGAK